MEDDYKNEYLLRLQKSILYNTLKLKCNSKDIEVVSLVENAVSYAVQRTKIIMKYMGEFTLHDEDHLFKVLFIMEKLLDNELINELSAPEIMLLILCAFFHDIGMSPDEKDVIAWKKVWDREPVFESNEEMKLYHEFKRYYSTRPDQHEHIERLALNGDNLQAETLKAHLITEYIRQTHAERALEIIDKEWNSKFKFRDVDLTVEFAQLCFSHNEDALTLLDLDKSYLCGPNLFACLPLIGVILRLSDILDFDAKRTPLVLFSHMYVRNPVSLKEWNKHRAIEAWHITPEIIQFNAKCSHPAIEASIHEFCNIIDHELSVCNNIISTINDYNKSKNRKLNLKFPYKVNRDKIKTQKNIHNQPIYIYKDTKFILSKQQVIDLLMGTKLYGSSEVALRELLQNSIDACLLRQAQEDKWGNLYKPEITVRYYNENGENILEVEDNGTGMDQYIIDNYYSKVGSSFYKSTDFFNLKAESSAEFTPTSRFGIGILSCFMVADTLIVETKRVYAQHKSSDALNITVEGQESIFWIRPGNKETPGTKTKLILRKQNPWEEMDENDFIDSVKEIIPNPAFKIKIEALSKTKIIDENSFSLTTADSLKDFSWQKNKNIRLFEIPINKKQIGIVGSAVVAILEKHKRPVSIINLNSKSIRIENEDYLLDREIRMGENAITEISKSITINDDGEIDESDSYSEFARSKSKISLHGIEVPTTLFPNSLNLKNNQVRISWPFPLLLVIDICGNRDLDLNSPRTQIIRTEKWLSLEENLAYIICNEISNAVSDEYWKLLKQNLISNTKNEVFLNSINRIKR